MTHYHFPLEKLHEYAEMVEAVLIFSGVILIVYILSSLYYWTTIDLKRSRPYDLNLGNKRLRQNVAPKNDKDLT